MTSGHFFAASHSVSAEEQAHVDSGGTPVLWPDATGSLDFYNEHDEPSAEPVPGGQGYPVHFTRPLEEAAGYGGYDAPDGGGSSTGSEGEEEEVDVNAAVAAADSEPEPGPEEPAAMDLAVLANSTAPAVVDLANSGERSLAVNHTEPTGDGQVPREDEPSAASLLQTRTVRLRNTATIPTPFGRRQVCGPKPSSSDPPPVCRGLACRAEDTASPANIPAIGESTAPRASPDASDCCTSGRAC